MSLSAGCKSFKPKSDTPLRQKPKLPFRSEPLDDIPNPANRSGVFSCVQKKERSRNVFPNKAKSTLAAAAKPLSGYALLVRIR